MGDSVTMQDLRRRLLPMNQCPRACRFPTGFTAYLGTVVGGDTVKKVILGEHGDYLVNHRGELVWCQVCGWSALLIEGEDHLVVISEGN